LIAALAAAGLLPAAPARAVEHGVYMAADYGKTRFGQTAADFNVQLEPFLESSFCTDIDCSNSPDAVFDVSSITRKSRGYDVWVGYQFTPWFAVEGAYLIHGKTRHSTDGTMDAGPVDVDDDGNVDYSGPQPLLTRTTFRTRGPAVAAVGSLELGNYLSLDARAGFFFADNKLTLRMQYSPEYPPDAEPQAYSYTEANGKTSLFYGATANFWILPYFAVRAGFTASGKASFDHSVRHYFVGIRYSYGY
jgi:hypothetical protein